MKPIIYKREASRLQKEILQHLHCSTLLFLLPVIVTSISILIFISFWYDDLTSLLFLTMFIFALPFIWVTMYIQWISRVIQHTLVKSKLDLWSMDRIDNLDEILTKASVIRKTISTLSLSLKTTRLFLKDSGKEFLKEKIIQEWEYFLAFLFNLKSDLTLNLSEQQEILESAKSEVEKNIHWTTELDQVSELQRARLDRQIEQFEELQRVLVKI